MAFRVKYCVRPRYAVIDAVNVTDVMSRYLHRLIIFTQHFVASCSVGLLHLLSITSCLSAKPSIKYIIIRLHHLPTPNQEVRLINRNRRAPSACDVNKRESAGISNIYDDEAL